MRATPKRSNLPRVPAGNTMPRPVEVATATPTQSIAAVRRAITIARRARIDVHLAPETVEFLIDRGEPEFGRPPFEMSGPCSKTAVALPLFDEGA
jgi:hypothetical protein